MDREEKAARKGRKEGQEGKGMEPERTVSCPDAVETRGGGTKCQTRSLGANGYRLNNNSPPIGLSNNNKSSP